MQKYQDLQAAIGMKVDPENLPQKGNEWITAIKNFLSSEADGIQLFNTASCQVSNWCPPEGSFPFLEKGHLYCFDIAVGKPSPLKNSDESSTPSLKRTKTREDERETSYAELEAATGNHHLTRQLGILAARMADLELLTSGTISTLADPNLPSSQARRDTPSVTDRLLALEQTAAKEALAMPPINTMEEADYEAMTQRVGDYLALRENSPWSHLETRIIQDTKTSLSEEILSCLRQTSTQQRIMHCMKEEVLATAKASAEKALDDYTATQHFSNLLQTAIKTALQSVSLTQIEEERAQRILYDYLRPRMLDLESRFVKKWQLPTASTPNLPQAMPSTPPRPTTISPITTPSTPTTTTESQPARTEAEMRALIAKENEVNWAKRNKQAQAANKVAAYLTATTGIAHKPSGAAIFKDLGDRAQTLGPNIVASYLEAADAWEKESKKQPAVPVATPVYTPQPVFPNPQPVYAPQPPVYLAPANPAPQPQYFQQPPPQTPQYFYTQGPR